MQFVAQRDQLQRAIATAQRAVSSRSTLPILSNILLDATADGVTLSATDHELGIVTHVVADVEKPGRTTLPARLLAEVVGAQSDGSVVVAVDTADHAEFRSGRSHMKVNGLPADEFPVIPELDDGTALSLPQAALKTAIGQVIIAAGTDETRARLMGIYWAVDDDGKLRLVCCDTHRLATTVLPLPEQPAGTVAHIIPGSAMREVERLLADSGEAQVDLLLTDSQAQFTIGATRLLTRLIEGEFPNWRKVVPNRTDWSLTVDRARLAAAVKRCAIVVRDDYRKVLLTIGQDGRIALTAASTKIGQAEEAFDADEVEVHRDAPDSVQIALNATYLHEPLAMLKCSQVLVGINAANHPATVRPANADPYVYVLMPMQIG
jgi:DNA polymerase III subunit beta